MSSAMVVSIGLEHLAVAVVLDHADSGKSILLVARRQLLQSPARPFMLGTLVRRTWQSQKLKMLQLAEKLILLV